ncbi:MAG TPA: prenyltransferase [Polyangiaceae bacterium]|nr:prenyltransferase [Polyangiaceae bacterium]
MIDAGQVIAFLKLGRPQFLIGGFSMFGLGGALAAVHGTPIDWVRYGWGQGFVTAVQWMTHYANDYFDLEADRANSTPTRWSGGSRVLVSGTVAPRVSLATSLVLAGVSLGAALKLAGLPDGPRYLLPLSLLILTLSWCYSAPPLRLLSRGLGEVNTALVVTVLTPLLGFYAQTGIVRAPILLACFPLVCLQFSMLLTIELPDAAGDAAQGKRTLVVRHGARWAARAAASSSVLAFGALPLLFLLGLPVRVMVLAVLPAPVAAWQAVRLWRGAFRESQRWESLALCSVALLVTTMLAELSGAVLTVLAKR